MSRFTSPTVRHAVCLLAIVRVAGLPLAARADVSPTPPAVPSAAEHVPVIIVGGGLGGLATAYYLGKHGIASKVLEAADHLGGKVQTAHYGPGLSAEYGMQEMWDHNPLLQIARELGLPLSEGVAAYSSVILGGKYFPFVGNDGQAFLDRVFSPSERKLLDAWRSDVERLLATVDRGARTKEILELEGLSMWQWLAEKRKLPKRIVEWIDLTLSCELAADIRDYSALFGVLEFRPFLHSPEKAFHIQGGNSRLIEALARVKLGQQVLGARVTRIERRRDPKGKLSVRVTYLEDNRARTITADRVVVSIPWVALPAVQLDPPLDPQRRQAIKSLGKGHYVVVHLVVDKKADRLWQVGGASPFALLTDGPLGVVYGINEPSPAAQPRQIFTLLIHGTEAAAWHMEPHDDEIKTLLSALDKLWPGFSRHVDSSHVYTYHPLAVTYWPVGRSPIDEGSRLLRQPTEGMYFAADWIEGAHSEGAVVAARRVAQQIANELGARGRP